MVSKDRLIGTRGWNADKEQIFCKIIKSSQQSDSISIQPKYDVVQEDEVT